MEQYEAYLNAQQDRLLSELFQLYAIPSISALSEHAQDVRRAALWVRDRLETAGLEHAQVLETGGHPVVYADWLHAPGRPTALFYGHMDTQPVDPIEQWNHPPFEPFVDGDRIYARGASDDKGSLMIAVAALEALLATRSSLPINVKVLFEGQEEIGSPQLGEFIANHVEMLACDVVINVDSGQFSETEPGVVVGLKGICALELEVRGPDHDVHSGSYGGAIQNPLHALARLVDSMHSPDGKVSVRGFYSDVAQLTEQDVTAIEAVPYDEQAYMEDLGVTELFGEPGYTTRQRAWARPTLEVNGMWGGFTGAGTKTVIPSAAWAKITCRLVPNQDPAQVLAAIKAHIVRHTPAGTQVTVRTTESGSPAYLVPVDDPYLQAAVEVLRDFYGQEPYLERSGGSVPVTTQFKKYLGVYAIGFGFGLPDERVHSPNEFFRKSSFRKGQSAICRLLDRLALPLGD
ncbi:MAG: dipeptidase [Anaerolineae bacterium]|jgi:acetylornithine deacetylase/succinyl-diaminopimelate desuccinylase-like protein|nr:dipeptidase [Chloroflexota bacterium]